MGGVPNPPAFPFAAEYGHPAACGGMTLRDYFAGQALAALITGRDWSNMDDGPDKVLAWANAAYLVADAMLGARTTGGAA